MNSLVCPNGHTSGDPEWCDTCGAPMTGGPSPSGASPSGASAPAAPTPAQTTLVAPVSCPHCAALNSADNLFCESCGYDFTTGQVPEPSPVVPVPDVAPETVTASWIVVVEIDPVWFGVKGELADRALPPASTSTVAITHHASLIGRSSRSRGLHPEVALDSDTAVSRRHAQLILDGDKLSVVDLASTNGTHVAGRGVVPTDALEPMASGVAALVDDGDQIFLGAWTRLTVRRV